jgi:hypothetical protein
MKKQINALIIIGIIGAAVFGSQVAVKYSEANWGNKDIWWTPMSLALPIDETRNEFEIYIKGDLLQKHLERGAISVAGKTGHAAEVIAPDNVKVRLNNWNKIRAEKLNSAMLTSFLLGVCLASLVMGVFQYVAKKQNN